jgi:hypothetical protein
MSMTRLTGITAFVLIGLISLATVNAARAQEPAEREGPVEASNAPMAQAVRQATASFREQAPPEYMLSGGCVSGPEEGAMGVHFVNPTLVEDGLLDVASPEALVYEPRNGRLRLAAVEYIVIAEPWDAGNDHPPVLNGQHFHYVSAPNRAGLPAYYELHVWAWKGNPRGTFADWNPRVSCDSYAGQ